MQRYTINVYNSYIFLRLKCVSQEDKEAKKAAEPVDVGESLQNMNKLLMNIDLKVSFFIQFQLTK